LAGPPTFYEFGRHLHLRGILSQPNWRQGMGEKKCPRCVGVEFGRPDPFWRRLRIDRHPRSPDDRDGRCSEDGHDRPQRSGCQVLLRDGRQNGALLRGGVCLCEVLGMGWMWECHGLDPGVAWAGSGSGMGWIREWHGLDPGMAWAGCVNVMGHPRDGETQVDERVW
jgi:hypothetical protein